MILRKIHSFLHYFDKNIWKYQNKSYLCVQIREDAHRNNLPKFNSKHFNAMETTLRLTHRLYKDEYWSEFIYQLEHGQIDGIRVTDESTEKVLVCVGELEDLQKLSSIMYCFSEAKIKSVFPSFITEKEHEEEQKKVYKDLFVHIEFELCQMIRKGNNHRWEDTEEYKNLHNIYCSMKEQMSCY